MEYMSNYDFYEVHLGSILSDSDRKVLNDLYQPIIGATALALFFKWWSDSETDNEQGFYSIDKLLTNIHITTDELLNCRRHLEALGLIRTFVKKVSDERSCYMFCLYAPKQPAEFFADPFLRELLIKYIGEKDVQKLANYYRIRIDTKDYEEITASFGEVFFQDINNLKKITALEMPHLKGRKEAVIARKFDVGKLVSKITQSHQIKTDSLSEEEWNQIAQIATIYGVDENIIDEYFDYFYDPYAPYQKRLLTDQLSKVIKNVLEYSHVIPKKKSKMLKNFSDSDSEYNDFINLLETTPAAQFLRLRQNNTVPSDADLSLIEDLSTKFNFSSGIINVLISYTLEMKNNTLPRNYVEKVAASLAREGVSSVIEALNYLNRVNKSNKSYKKTTEAKPKETKMFEDEDYVAYDPTLEDEDDE